LSTEESGWGGAAWEHVHGRMQARRCEEDAGQRAPSRSSQRRRGGARRAQTWAAARRTHASMGAEQRGHRGADQGSGDRGPEGAPPASPAGSRRPWYPPPASPYAGVPRLRSSRTRSRVPHIAGRPPTS
jgi:hypothetical protein